MAAPVNERPSPYLASSPVAWALLFFLLSGLCLRRVQLMGVGNDRASEVVSRRVCRGVHFHGV